MPLPTPDEERMTAYRAGYYGRYMEQQPVVKENEGIYPNFIPKSQFDRLHPPHQALYEHDPHYDYVDPHDKSLDFSAYVLKTHKANFLKNIGDIISHDVYVMLDETDKENWMCIKKIRDVKHSTYNKYILIDKFLSDNERINTLGSQSELTKKEYDELAGLVLFYSKYYDGLPIMADWDGISKTWNAEDRTYGVYMAKDKYKSDMRRQDTLIRLTELDYGQYLELLSIYDKHSSDLQTSKIASNYTQEGNKFVRTVQYE